MIIHFTALGPDCRWNLKMAKIVHLLWEVAQLNAINLPLTTGYDVIVQNHVSLMDFRISGKILLS